MDALVLSAREKVLQLFEKHRAAPGAEYDEARFLDYLLAKPGRVHDSFQGLRRYNAFLDDVQYEFAICFSLKDFEANHSLTTFVDRVVALQNSRRGSLASLKNRTHGGPGWQSLVFTDIILMVLVALSWNNARLLTVVVAVAAAVNLWFVRFAWRSQRYLARLRERIETTQ